MELHRYLNVLRKHLASIVLLTLLGAGSAYWFSARQPKVYQATATLVINAGAPSSLIPYLSAVLGTNNGGVAPVEALAASYAFLLQSRSFDAQVIQKLHLAVTPAQLGTVISSALIPNTNYWTISVDWNDPVQAAAIANGIARIFIQANAATQATARSSVAASDIGQALTYFHNKIRVLQRRFDAILANQASTPAQVSSAEDQLSTLEDTYYKLLADAGTGALSSGTNTAALSDPAVVPSLPIAAHVTRNALFGLLAGLVIGLALAFLLDYLDYSLRTPEDVEQLVGQAPLGAVGTISTHERHKRRGLFARGFAPRASRTPRHSSAPGTLSVLNPQLVTLNHPEASISETFRALRTNLEFSSLDKPLKSLVVTSALPGEGKSTVAANLAIAVAQAGKQVILVDANLRQPSLSALFHVSSATGFTTALLIRDRQARAWVLDGELLLRTMVPNLRILASGPRPPNPAELLASETMTAVLRDLEERADLVIFDTPAMGMLTDAVVLSARVSGTLLVIRAGSTRRTVITSSINAVQKVGGNVVGTVLNMTGMKPSTSTKHSYYDYQTYARATAEATTGGGTRGT